MTRVLIMEPQAADARALKTSLREAGLSTAVTVVKSASGARTHLEARDHQPVLFINVHTEDGDGMSLLDWLTEQRFYPDMLVIAVGERGQLRGVVEACERGAHTFIIKPVHIEDLKNLARSHPGHWDGRTE